MFYYRQKEKIFITVFSISKINRHVQSLKSIKLLFSWARLLEQALV